MWRTKPIASSLCSDPAEVGQRKASVERYANGLLWRERRRSRRVDQMSAGSSHRREAAIPRPARIGVRLRRVRAQSGHLSAAYAAPQGDRKRSFAAVAGRKSELRSRIASSDRRETGVVGPLTSPRERPRLFLASLPTGDREDDQAKRSRAAPRRWVSSDVRDRQVSSGALRARPRSTPGVWRRRWRASALKEAPGRPA